MHPVIGTRRMGGKSRQHFKDRIRKTTHIQYVVAGLCLRRAIGLKINADQPGLWIAIAEGFPLMQGFGAAPVLRIGPRFIVGDVDHQIADCIAPVEFEQRQAAIALA